MDKPSPLTETTVPGSASAASPAVWEPQPAEILAELALVLKSEAFAGAARQQRLLRHLVEKRLAGGVGELKEYTLGVEVFDRGENFDSRLDPIVRVEASRLRSRLQKYYEGVGVADPIRINLPRGAYVPSFTQRVAPTPEPVTAVGQTLPAAESTVAKGEPVPPSEVEPPAEKPMPFAAKLGLAGAGIVLVTFILVTLRRPATQVATPDFLHFRRITSDSSACTSPTFSPDGKTIAYARKVGPHWHVYARNVDTLATRDLTGGSDVDNRQPAWSPTGNAIAFRSERDGGGIFLVDSDTLQVTRVTTSGYHPAWSPDGKRIAFSTATYREPGETSSDQPSSLEIVDVGTRAVTRVGGPDLVRDAVQPAWSPDGKRIAFWGSDEDGDRDIWTIRASEGVGNEAPRPLRVTHDSWIDWSPAWSPDGRFLYFSSDRAGAMNLWRVRIDQSTGSVLGPAEPVTTPSSYTGWVAFADSGHAFAYVQRLMSSQLYRAPFSLQKGVQSDREVQLTAGERIVREPEVSPDGKWILVRVQDPQEDLALVRPDGTDFHRLTNDRFDERSPHWSPDGNYIVFDSNRSGKFELWSIWPDGTHLQPLTSHGDMAYAWNPKGVLVGFPQRGKPVALDPPGASPGNWDLPEMFRPIAWSPSHNYVAGRMRSNAFGAAALFVLAPGSSDFWEIAHNAPYPTVAWLRDGTHLLFSRDDGIYLADVDRHSLRPEPVTANGEIHSRFALSPDDSQVFFVSSDDEQDIWLATD